MEWAREDDAVRRVSDEMADKDFEEQRVRVTVCGKTWSKLYRYILAV